MYVRRKAHTTRNPKDCHPWGFILCDIIRKFLGYYYSNPSQQKCQSQNSTQNPMQTCQLGNKVSGVRIFLRTYKKGYLFGDTLFVVGLIAIS